MGWVIRDQDNGGRKMKLEQTKYIDMISLSRGSALNIEGQGDKT